LSCDARDTVARLLVHVIDVDVLARGGIPLELRG
jgi:hypothetical protein